MARLVVFKDPADLVDMRELLYGDALQQARGLARAKAYQIRGNLPPSVHVTCLLVAALHNDVPGTDFYAIRQVYAMALIRFVNEMLDVYQVGRAVVPLHVLAAQMGLPNAFVELRHAATHEDLPSVFVLREMANRALAWLMENFWSKQNGVSVVHDQSHPNHTQGRSGELPGTKRQKTGGTLTPKDTRYASPDHHDENPEDDVGARIKELLREWRRLRRGEAAAQPPAELLCALETEWQNDEAEFLDVCLNRNILVPTGNAPLTKRSISQVIAMWLPLFQSLGSQICEELESSVVTALGARQWPTMKTEKREFPILEAWSIALAPYLNTRSARMLKGVPRPWNAQILAISASETGDVAQYKFAEEMALLTGTDIIEFSANEPAVPGWRILKNWTPRPLGT